MCVGQNFVINYVLKVGSDETLLRTQKGFINKVNLILVQVRYTLYPAECRLLMRCTDSQTRMAVQLADLHP